MYLEMFGGAALLHLLAAHPRVVALFGIAATVTVLVSPEAPGGLLGSGAHLDRIEAAVRPQAAIGDKRQANAEHRAAAMLARNQRVELLTAVDAALDRCGAGCTDMRTNAILEDRVLLRRVITLYELDQQARVGQAPLSGTH